MYRRTALTSLTSIILLALVSCNPNDYSNPDCPLGLRIIGVKTSPSQTLPEDIGIGGSENYIIYEYKADWGGQVFDLTAYLWDQSGGITYGTVAQLSGGIIGDANCHIAYITWDGKMTNPGNRRFSVPPGNYNMRLVYSYVSWSDWKALQVNHNSWDTDGDDISDAVEQENNKETGIGQTPIIDADGNTQTGWFVWNNVDYPRVISTTLLSSNILYPNRGMHDYSIAEGTVTSGSLHNGLRIAHASTGYSYNRGTDIIDTDNWGILELINLIEVVGRKWALLYPINPLLTTMDMSLGEGGDWTPDHTQHQKGLEVDLRYIRNDNSSGICDLYLEPGDPDGLANPADYSSSRTQDLVDIIASMPQVYTIIVHQNTNLRPDSKVTVDANINKHTDHMHVWLNDPDGASN